MTKNEIRREIEQRLSDNIDSYHGGELEHMAQRIAKLEEIIAYQTAFIAEKLRLTDAEIDGVDGILDW